MSGEDHRSTVFKIDGTEYIFNYCEFRRAFEALKGERGAKRNARDKILEKTELSESTFAGWRKGAHGPKKLKTVEIMEDVLAVPRRTFLMERPTDMTTQEEKTPMHEIMDYEREVARALYADMCDMIDGLEYTANVANCEVFKNLRHTEAPYIDRDAMMLKVRKKCFDLSVTVREQLLELIRDAFGTDIGEEAILYFDSQAYREYLEKNGFIDDEETRYLYSDLHLNRLYKRLDEVFSEYLCN